MKKTLCVLFVLVMACSALLTGCGGSNSESGGQDSKSEVYKIGFVNDLTGDGSMYGESMRKATELAVEEINEAGGIDGKKIEVIYEDGRSTAADTIAAFNKVVDVDKVPVVLGTTVSTRTLAFLPIAKQKNIAVIAQSATAPSLRQWKGTFFGMMPTDEAQGKGLSDLAEKLGTKEVAVMYINNDYGIGIKDNFIKDFTAKGGKVIQEIGFDPGKTDYRAELLKMKQANPKYIVIVSLVVEGGNILKQAKELDIKAQWIGDSCLQTNDLIKLAGAGAEGLLAIQHGQTEGNPEFDKYAQAFKGMWGTTPTIWSHYSYEATKLVAEGIKQNGYTADGIKQYLYTVKDRPVAWGTLTMDSDGIAEGVFSYYIVEGGQFRYWEG